VNVIIRPRAEESIVNICNYIIKKGYPKTALEFLDRMRIFAHSLGDFPEKYSICSQKSYQKRKFRCVVFEDNFIFIHKQIGNDMVLLNVVHASRIRL
jgi:plasmid stabilization system protein ParE